MLEGMTTDKIIKGLATIVMIAAIVAVVGYLWQVVVYIAAAAVFALLGRRLVSLIASIKVLGRNISRNIAASRPTLSAPIWPTPPWKSCPPRFSAKVWKSSAVSVLLAPSSAVTAI